MFSNLQLPERGGSKWSLLASVALHGTVFLALGIRLGPVFVKPSLVAHGDKGSAVLVYSPRQASSDTVTAPLPQKARLTLPAREASRPKPDLVPQPQIPNQQMADQQVASTPAGSPYGSDPAGVFTGDEVRPALPLSFTDLHVSRTELPPGVEGDVIVEITIDSEGLVVEEKLVKTIGYGIDQRVLAALHEWRFRPATRNGVAIPSKHDVHYHFPG
ncbi:MAG TPA: TonB family protein [Verrucomicrobiae bacterium]|nr:TonB family protein [Verrucomicrobiae bacterium]